MEASHLSTVDVIVADKIVPHVMNPGIHNQLVILSAKTPRTPFGLRKGTGRRLGSGNDI
jgi:hypothetical protein